MCVGLDDAGRNWFLKVESDLKEMKCTQSKVDPCLFFFFLDNGELGGIIYLYVDDFLHLGGSTFEEEVVRKIHKVYKIGKMESGNFSYTGLQVHSTDAGIVVNQADYISNLENVEVPRELKRSDLINQAGKSPLRQAVGQANWAARRTRPEVSFDLMELSMKFNSTTVAGLIRANKVIEKLKSNQSSIVFPKLKGSLKFITHSDASFANLIDGVSSGRGHVIFLTDEANKAAPLGWTTNKVRRVVTSTLAAEALSLEDCLSHAQYLRYMVAEAMKVKPTDIPIIAYTDSENLYKSLYSTSLVNDQKLRIDIGAIKQAIQEENISVKWITNKQMLADSFTKKGADSKMLMDVLKMGKMPSYDD